MEGIIPSLSCSEKTARRIQALRHVTAGSDLHGRMPFTISTKIPLALGGADLLPLVLAQLFSMLRSIDALIDHLHRFAAFQGARK